MNWTRSPKLRSRLLRLSRDKNMAYNETPMKETAMFANKSEPDGLDQIIDELQQFLLKIDPDSDKYTATVENLSKLHKLRGEPSKPISRDAILTTAGSIVGILLILNFERLNVVTSKAISFVTKLR